MEKLLESLINLFGLEMPELSTIDEDYGQLEMINQENRDTYPLTFPAVLIDASDVSWSNIAGLSQKGEATVRVRLIIDCYDDTHYGSTTTDRIAQRAAMRAKVHKLLQGYRIDDEAQLARIISQIRALNGNPLLCIDEEGGRVSRIANNPKFNVKKYESMAAIGATGDPQNAYECGHTIGTYLNRYGIDIDFAPVADVNTNPDNIIIGPRAFSDDPELAASMVVNYLQGLKDAGVTGCIKHFPGHGDTQADTHTGYVQSLKTWDEMKVCEMVTFRAGIDWGCQLIMTAHIAVPNVTGSSVPSTMSPVVLQDKLRGELGYQNIIITDGMEMGAITQHYSSGEAAVGSIQAGVDIVLGPRSFTEAFDAVIAAVNNGTISEERINQSVRRILTLRAHRD